MQWEIFIARDILAGVKRALNHRRPRETAFDQTQYVRLAFTRYTRDIVIASWFTTPIAIQLSRTARYYRQDGGKRESLWGGICIGDGNRRVNPHVARRAKYVRKKPGRGKGKKEKRIAAWQDEGVTAGL